MFTWNHGHFYSMHPKQNMKQSNDLQNTSQDRIYHSELYFKAHSWDKLFTERDLQWLRTAQRAFDARHLDIPLQ